MTLLVVLLLALAPSFVSAQFNDPANERVTEVCLGCICEAMSGCNLTRGCAENDCGMFRMTKLYWVDAGQPTLPLETEPGTDGENTFISGDHKHRSAVQALFAVRGNCYHILQESERLESRKRGLFGPTQLGDDVDANIGQTILVLVDAYQRCALDPVCAARTVRGYMSKFIDKDCNGDGRVDCFDYAASHFNGGYSCSNPLDTDYARTVRNCLTQVSGLARNS